MKWGSMLRQNAGKHVTSNIAWVQSQKKHKRFSLLIGPNKFVCYVVTQIHAFLSDQTSFQIVWQTGCQYVDTLINLPRRDTLVFQWLTIWCTLFLLLKSLALFKYDFSIKFIANISEVDISLNRSRHYLALYFFRSSYFLLNNYPVFQE